MKKSLVDIDIEIILLLTQLYLPRISKKKRKRWLVRPYLTERRNKGRFAKDMQDLRNNPEDFKENFHMSVEKFDLLLSLVEADLRRVEKKRPKDFIGPIERLCVTLEYLAGGCLQRHIASTYRISKQMVGRIIEETCKVIMHVLKPTYLPDLTKTNWIDIANDYNARWNFPNCLGSVDGKHVGIKAPRNSGSIFYNYKGFHSIVLMGVADASSKFLYFDIGAYGSENDSTVFKNCDFGRNILQENMNLPNDSKVYGRDLPFYFLADDAFPLHRRIMKPFSPQKGLGVLTEEQRKFNYRLSRARRCIENAFGILSARWYCLGRTMILSPDRAQIVTGACVLLHNFLVKESPDTYCPSGFADYYDDDDNLVEGIWRQHVPENTMSSSYLPTQQKCRPTKEAVEIREHLKKYVNSEDGQLIWQDKSVFLN